MAVELSGSGINWCEPQDLDIDDFVAMFGANRAGNATGSHPGGFNVLMADGAVRFVSFSMDKGLAKALATCNGGEQIGAW